VVVDPYLGRSGNVTFTLSEDLAPPIAINDPPVLLTFRPGQNARITFTGTAGQRVSVGLSDMTLATGYCCDIGSIAMYKPDGSVLLAPYAFTNAGQGTPSQVLPVSGTYSVVVDPYLGRSGNATFTLSGDIVGQVIINGPAVPLNFNVGQNARLTFDGTAGQRVSVGLSGITISPGYCCDIGSIAMYKPDGTVLLNPLAFTNAGQGTPSQVLPVTGTYSVVVDPYLGRSGNVTFALSEDLNPQISISGPPVPLVFRVGQNAFVRFAGSASQHLTIRITSNALGYITVKLLKPDGTQLTSATSSGTSFNLPSQTLPVSGTYTISIDPPGSINGGLTVTANSP